MERSVRGDPAGEVAARGRRTADVGDHRIAGLPHVRVDGGNGHRHVVAAIRARGRCLDHVALGLQPVDRGGRRVHRAGGCGGRDRCRHVDLSRSRLARRGEGQCAADAQRARYGDRTRSGQPCSAQAHDGTCHHAWPRAGTVESRTGRQRNEADRGADGGRDGDVNGAHAVGDSSAVLPVATPGTRAMMNHDHAHHQGDEGSMVDDFRRRFWISLALTIPVLATSEMLQHLLGLRGVLAFPGARYVEFGFASAVYFYGGWPFLTGLVAELRKRLPGMMTLVGLAISVAYLYSAAVVFGLRGTVFFWETATLIDIMLLGHWIEMRSVMGASRALEELVRLLPAEAHRLRPDGSTEDVPVTELRQGDPVLVKPGERIPSDGAITEGRTSVNQALLTGESQPVEKSPGDAVLGGAVNGEAAITLRITRTGAETYLAQVIELVRRAQQTRSRTQDLADRAAMWLTVIAIAAGATTLIAWLAGGQSFDFALERMVTVMVITCPHALGLAVPLVVAVSTSISARNGLLIRDRAAFELARALDAVAFDKTGTLTEGRFGVTDVVSLNGRSDAEILRLAAEL